MHYKQFSIIVYAKDAGYFHGSFCISGIRCILSIDYKLFVWPGSAKLRRTESPKVHLSL